MKICFFYKFEILFYKKTKMRKCSICDQIGHYKNNRKYHTKQEIEEYDNKVLARMIVGNIFRNIIKANNKMDFQSTNDIIDIIHKNNCILYGTEIIDSSDKPIGKWEEDGLVKYKNGSIVNDINSLFKNSGLENEKKVRNEFDTNEEYKKLFNKIRPYTNGFISDKPIKNNGYSVRCTPKWIEKKCECDTIGSDETSSKPKTDIIFKNNDIFDKISLKMGEGRATSCGAAEFYCIIHFVYEEYFKDNYIYKEAYDKLEEIYYMMKERGKHPVNSKSRTKRSIKLDLDRKKLENMDLDLDEIWVEETENKCKDMNKMWVEIKEKFPKFIESIIFECLSGQLKFGDNIGRADWLVITENKSTNIKEIIELNRAYLENSDLNNYIKEYLYKNKNPFNFKSGGTGKALYVRFF